MGTGTLTIGPLRNPLKGLKTNKPVFLRVELDFCFGFVEDPCGSGAGLLPCYLAHQEEKRNLMPLSPALFLMAVAHNLIHHPQLVHR